MVSVRAYIFLVIFWLSSWREYLLFRFFYNGLLSFLRFLKGSARTRAGVVFCRCIVGFV